MRDRGQSNSKHASSTTRLAAATQIFEIRNLRFGGRKSRADDRGDQDERGGSRVT